METIAAISTPAGAGAIAIVRMSGNKALRIAEGMFNCGKLKKFSDAVPNMMYYGTLTVGDYKDKCLAVYFKAPLTYTGEDIVEFQCHGGARLAREVLSACLDRGARLADKGEFTKRAFLNGKLALSDAEAVIDMINAESGAQLKASYRMMTGKLSDEIKGFSDRLLDAAAALEASMDYPEEMEDESVEDASVAVERAIKEVKALLATARTGGYIRNGVDVAIAGRANVGKSSLLNALCGRERAIVTDIAGTTRDSLEERIEKDGVMINLIDTAGIRKTDDKVEKLGVERSLAAVEQADAVLFVTPAGEPVSEEDERIKDRIPKDAVVFEVRSKSDLHPEERKEGVLYISSKTGEGIEELKEKIVSLVKDGTVDASGNIIVEERHKEALGRALASLLSAKKAIDEGLPTECVALDVRQAYAALGEITGETADEAVVDAVFSKFCVGK